MLRRLTYGAALALLLLTLGGCDFGSSGGGGGGTTLELTDFKFTPDNFSAPTGQTITVTLANKSQTKHNFTVEAGVDKKVDQDVDPGKTVTVTFTPTASGAIAFHCEYHQKSYGMQGTINGGGAGGGSSAPPTTKPYNY